MQSELAPRELGTMSRPCFLYKLTERTQPKLAV